MNDRNYELYLRAWAKAKSGHAFDSTDVSDAMDSSTEKHAAVALAVRDALANDPKGIRTRAEVGTEIKRLLGSAE